MTTHQVCTYIVRTFLNHKNALPAQLSLAMAQRLRQRRPVPCLALRCGAGPCCTVLSFDIQYQISCVVPGTRYHYVRVYSYFCFFSGGCPLSVLFMFFFSFFFLKLHRTGNQNVTSPIKHAHSTAQRAISSAQVALGLIKSLVAPNHGPLRSAPFTFTCVLPCASVAGGVSCPRSRAEILYNRYHS